MKDSRVFVGLTENLALFRKWVLAELEEAILIQDFVESLLK